MVSLAVVGCVNQPYTPPVAYNSAHIAECRLEAMKATGSAGGGTVATPYQTSQTIANDLATGMRQGEIMTACLELKKAQMPR